MNKQLIAILFFISALLLLGFSKKPKQPIELPETKPPTVQPEKLVLAWGEKHPDWDKVLIEEIKKYDWSTVEMPCKKISKESCVAQLISKMAQYESGFDPSESYKEDFKDSSGAYVVSRGLLQISKESANDYKCQGKTTLKIIDAKDLHDYGVNLKCGVKILNKWGLKHKVLYGGKTNAWLGGSKYWSVLRCPKDSCNAIMDYMGKFK